MVERLKLKLLNRQKGIIALRNLGQMITGTENVQEQKEQNTPELKGASAGGSRGKIKIKIKPFQGCQNQSQGKTAVKNLSRMIGF